MGGHSISYHTMATMVKLSMTLTMSRSEFRSSRRTLFFVPIVAFRRFFVSGCLNEHSKPSEIPILRVTVLNSCKLFTLFLLLLCQSLPRTENSQIVYRVQTSMAPSITSGKRISGRSPATSKPTLVISFRRPCVHI